MNPFQMLDMIRRTHPDGYWRARITTYLAMHRFPMKEGAANEWRNPPSDVLPIEGEQK